MWVPDSRLRCVEPVCALLGLLQSLRYYFSPYLCSVAVFGWAWFQPILSPKQIQGKTHNDSIRISSIGLQWLVQGWSHDWGQARPRLLSELSGNKLSLSLELWSLRALKASGGRLGGLSIRKDETYTEESRIEMESSLVTSDCLYLAITEARFILRIFTYVASIYMYFPLRWGGLVFLV